MNSITTTLCRQCGCSDLAACPGGCSWIPGVPGICSACVEKLSCLDVVCLIWGKDAAICIRAFVHTTDVTSSYEERHDTEVPKDQVLRAYALTLEQFRKSAGTREATPA